MVWYGMVWYGMVWYGYGYGYGKGCYLLQGFELALHVLELAEIELADAKQIALHALELAEIELADAKQIVSPVESVDPASARKVVG